MPRSCVDNSQVRRVFRHVLCVWMMGGAVIPSPAFADTATSSAMPSATSSATIQWLRWSAEAFERADAEDKLILLDLTAIWCHACHVMDETTYRDSRVVAMLNVGFIPVRVEADQHPDITARYKQGGWPTTSILLPSGAIVFQANFLTSDNMLEGLRAADEAYRADKQGMAERVANVWARVESAERARRPSRGAIQPALLGHLLDVMQRRYDRVNGGFGDAPKFFEPDAVTLAFAHHFWNPDSGYRQMALFTLDRQLRLYDPVWGGFFRYAEEADWSKPHYEKMLYIQASNILNYLEAYQMTGLASYRDVVEGTVSYVMRVLADRDRGGFYASQDADVRKGNGVGVAVPGDEFFALNDSQRLAMGTPAVDRTMLTDWNGMMAKALLKVAQAMGNDQAREFALTTLQRLYHERYQPGRGLAHFLRDGHARQFGLLADQVFFADALLEAFLTTGAPRYLAQAETIIADAIRLLEDDQGGGYVDRPPTAPSLGLLKFPHKDLRVNAALSMVLTDMLYLTGNPLYRDRARNLLQFITGNMPLPVAQTGRAIHRFLHYPVHMVVVGDTASVEAQALFRRSLAVYVPGKIVRWLDPAMDALELGDVTFPRVPGAFAYICTERLCSSPVAQADELTDAVQEMFVAMTESAQPFPAIKSVPPHTP